MLICTFIMRVLEIETTLCHFCALNYFWFWGLTLTIQSKGFCARNNQKMFEILPHINKDTYYYLIWGFLLQCFWITFSVENPLFLHILDQHQRNNVWQFIKGKWKAVMQFSNPIRLSYCWNVSMERGYGNIKKCGFCIWELKVC